MLHIADATKCKPGSIVPADDGCNTCICSPTGEKAACTVNACLQTRDIPDDDKCEIGTNYEPDACNTCLCLTGSKKEGKCTRMACEP